jgi:hypothetical protein
MLFGVTALLLSCFPVIAQHTCKGAHCTRADVSRQCASELEVRISHPMHGQVIEDGVPEIHFEVTPRVEQVTSCPDCTKLELFLDGNSIPLDLGAVSLPYANQVSLAGLSIGLHTLDIRLDCGAGDATTPPGDASTQVRFVYLPTELNDGDEDEWQLSFVQTVELRSRIRTLTAAFQELAAEHAAREAALADEKDALHRSVQELQAKCG